MNAALIAAFLAWMMMFCLGLQPASCASSLLQRLTAQKSRRTRTNWSVNTHRYVQVITGIQAGAL